MIIDPYEKEPLTVMERALATLVGWGCILLVIALTLSSMKGVWSYAL